jgi:hypothetical protein
VPLVQIKWRFDASDLVPGDVVSVSGGEILPPDLLLTDGKYLSVDQALGGFRTYAIHRVYKRR